MKRLFLVLTIVASGGWTLLHGARARATCCQTTADCPRGFACNGGVCDARDVDCTCDTDCGPNLFCLPAVATVCTQKAGSTTQDCHPQGQCSTAWKRPCATTADCGPGGFTCVANGQFCSGADCQVTSTCVAPALPNTCTTDADCPAAWTCEPDTAQVTACIPDAPHSCPSNGCPPVTLTGARSCLPPLFDLVGLGGFAGPPVVLPSSCPVKAGPGGASGAAAGGASGATGAAGSAGATGGSPGAAGAPGSQGGTSGAHATGGAGPAGPPAGGSSGQQQQADAGGATSHGCQLAAGGNTGSMFLLGFLGLVAVSRRRRIRSRGQRRGPGR